ncbi:NFX1-type zinc finger-containing protein 1-like isoform X1 [Haliotis rufescens]|uniref:NFX1-type zinc finger-containing protein 1-like isoform X1 n=1 Tax=Haliotis rufescens TaxID=6454 RepID=UPI00201ED8FA|nr:NFX1-type zinc finger-containing protein 1-like isoform X1 [Haliotis rufescens]
MENGPRSNNSNTSDISCEVDSTDDDVYSDEDVAACNEIADAIEEGEIEEFEEGELDEREFDDLENVRSLHDMEENAYSENLQYRGSVLEVGCNLNTMDSRIAKHQTDRQTSRKKTSQSLTRKDVSYSQGVRKDGHKNPHRKGETYMYGTISKDRRQSLNTDSEQSLNRTLRQPPKGSRAWKPEKDGTMLSEGAWPSAEYSNKSQEHMRTPERPRSRSSDRSRQPKYLNRYLDDRYAPGRNRSRSPGTARPPEKVRNVTSERAWSPEHRRTPERPRSRSSDRSRQPQYLNRYLDDRYAPGRNRSRSPGTARPPEKVRNVTSERAWSPEHRRTPERPRSRSSDRSRQPQYLNRYLDDRYAPGRNRSRSPGTARPPEKVRNVTSERAWSPEHRRTPERPRSRSSDRSRQPQYLNRYLDDRYAPGRNRSRSPGTARPPEKVRNVTSERAWSPEHRRTPERPRSRSSDRSRQPQYLNRSYHHHPRPEHMQKHSQEQNRGTKRKHYDTVPEQLLQCKNRTDRTARQRIQHKKKRSHKSGLVGTIFFLSKPFHQPNDIAATLANRSEELETYLCNNEICPHIVSLVTVLEKCSKATLCHESKLKVMYVLRTRKFFERKDIIDKLKDLQSFSDMESSLAFVIELLTLMKAMIHVVQLEKGDILISKSLIESSPQIKDEKCERLKDLLGEISELYRKQNEMPPASKAMDEYPVIHEPILPSIDMIKSGEKNSIPKHGICIPFASEQHYVAHMYAVFREDFVQPLVNGIRKYISHTEKRSMERFWSTDVKLYENVQVISNAIQIDNGMTQTIQFQSNFHKRSYIPSVLQYGALLCLSHDGFQSIHYATVANRDANKLCKGQIDIKFVEDSNLPELLEVTFVMLECRAFYEAYSHSLASLKIMAQDLESNKQVLPLGKYLTGQSQNVSHPSYLDTCDEVSFSCLKHYGDKTLKPQNSDTAQVRKLESWPCCADIGLDTSQLEALKLVLNNEIALIQGPPGTGKTMMGIRIAEVLLSNKVMWQGQSPYPLMQTHRADSGLHHEGKGPLLLVSYTNHALDQFLQLLLNSPVMDSCQDQDIIRVGSRCEVEELFRFALKKHRRRQPSCAYNQSFGVLKGIEKDIDELRKSLLLYQTSLIHEDSFKVSEILSSFHHSQFEECKYYDSPNNNSILWEWLALPDSLSYTECTADGSIFQEEFILAEDIRNEDNERIIDDNDDFVSPHGITTSPFDLEIALDFQQLRNDRYFSHLSENGCRQIIKGITELLALQDNMTCQEVGTIYDIWELDVPDRWRLYRHWVHQATHPLRKKLRCLEQEYEAASRRYCEACSLLDSRIMKRASLVAMTTTAAARYTRTLQEVGAPVVIIEEAAQVSEQHVLGALSPSCQHLIMIGDHQQLRPAFNDYSLAKSHHTDVSLFERLVRGGITFQQLENQHRMRPEISQLLVPHIYKTLKDDESVFCFPDVRGMATNVYFLTHDIEEDHDEGSLSHRNKYEADFLTKLYRHLRLQGYLSSEITVLALYNDQVQALRKSIRDTERDCLLLQTQKEEQMNSEIEPTHKTARNSGVRITSVDNFQGEENKIILLSLVRSNKSGRIGHLSASNRVCVALSRAKEGLYVIGNMECLRNASPLWDKIVTKAEEKGICGKFLKLKCSKHPEKVMEVKTAKDFDQYSDGGCDQACNARLKCGHRCSRRCHPDDPEHARLCIKVVDKHCKEGHIQKKKCCEEIAKCKETINVQLPKCGHTAKKPCFKDVGDVQCEERCTEIIPCGHVCQRKCGQVCNTEDNCNELVKKTGKCGHSCQIACSQTILCKIECQAQLDCGHPCKGTCGKCHQGRLHQPCRKKCERKLICGHICKASCTDVCPPCRQPCEQKCGHSKCGYKCGDRCVPCKEPCRWRCRKNCNNRYECTKLCSKDCNRNRCNMPCTRTMPCGHKCTALNCEKCVCRKCEDQTHFEIFFGTEDEPDAVFYKLPDCNHIFEVTSLDMYMDSESESIGMKTCPKCTSPIMTSERYGTCIRQCQKEMDVVKCKLLSKSSEMAKEKNILTQEFSKIHNQEHQNIFRKQLTSTRNTDQVASLSNQVGFYLNVRSTEDNLDSIMSEDCLDRVKVQGMKDELSSLMKWVLLKRVRFSDQELSEFKMELTRIRLCYRYLLVQDKLSAVEVSDEKRKCVEDSSEKLLSGQKLLQEELEGLEAELKKLEAEYPRVGLGITDEERIMVLQAMGFSQKGHWYKCKKGHVYAIGECGGAMQESKCPECAETIGGARHQLRGDNSLATEMDGAQFAAWSDQANMANYDLD